MKRLVGWTLVAVAATALWCLPGETLAQGRGGPRAGARPGGGPGGPGGPGARPMMGGGGPREAINELGLSDEQRTQANDAVRKAAEGMDMTRLGELRQEMQAARQANDQAKIQTLQEEQRRLEAARTQKIQDALKPLLNAEQQDKLAKLLTSPELLRPIAFAQRLKASPEVNLTADQKGKIDDVLKAHREGIDKLNVGDAEGARTLAAKTDADLRAVLTPEQQDKVRAMMAPGPGPAGPGGGMADRLKARLKACDATAAQEKSANDLIAAAEQAVKDKPDSAREVFQKLNQDIRALLTAEQQKKWDEQQPMRRPGGAGGQRGGAAGQRGGAGM